jgi:hypothetical protein
MDWWVDANASEKHTASIFTVQPLGIYQPVYMAPKPRRISSPPSA